MDLGTRLPKMEHDKLTAIFITLCGEKYTPFLALYVEMLQKHLYAVFCKCPRPLRIDFCCATVTKKKGVIVGRHEKLCVKRSCPGCGGVGFGFQCAPYCILCLFDKRPTVFCRSCRLYVH